MKTSAPFAINRYLKTFSQDDLCRLIDWLQISGGPDIVQIIALELSPQGDTVNP